MADEAVKTRRRDATSNTERLITAARSVFARNGQASLEEIAAEAGLGIATLYRHFPNRELLTRAVYRSIFDTELVPLLTESCAQSTPRATFMAIADRLLDLVDRERGLIASSANFAVLTDELLRDFVDPFAILLRRAQHAGESSADEPQRERAEQVGVVGRRREVADDAGHRGRGRHRAPGRCAGPRACSGA